MIWYTHRGCCSVGSVGGGPFSSRSRSAAWGSVSGTKCSARLEDVVDQPAQKRDVAACPDRRVDVAQRARAGKARIGMDEGCPALFGLEHEAERDRMVLR